MPVLDGLCHEVNERPPWSPCCRPARWLRESGLVVGGVPVCSWHKGAIVKRHRSVGRMPPKFERLGEDVKLDD